MVLITKESLSTTTSRVMESIPGQTPGSFKAIGLLTKCTAREYSLGLTEDAMKVTTLKIKNKDSARLHGKNSIF
jgi:hypothetical protein